MTRFPLLGLALAAALAACGGGGDDDGDDPGDGDLPTTPPEEVTVVADEGFESPRDAVASPDGETFYFSAYTADSHEPGIFSVSADGGEVELLVAGLPLENPPGLLLSCDGETLYVADFGVTAAEAAASGIEGQSVLYTLATGGGALSALQAGGIEVAAGLAMGIDCETLRVTGINSDGEAALFSLSREGGTASVVHAGEPFQQLTGVFIDADDVSWCMDHMPRRAGGGVLWAVTPEGEVSEIVGGLGLSENGGVSLTAGGGTAVIPNYSEDTGGHLLAVDIESGDTTVVESDMKDPAGIRTARGAGVFAVADGEQNRIYSAR
jgi:hypothetical protein